MDHVATETARTTLKSEEPANPASSEQASTGPRGCVRGPRRQRRSDYPTCWRRGVVAPGASDAVTLRSRTASTEIDNSDQLAPRSSSPLPEDRGRALPSPNAQVVG